MSAPVDERKPLLAVNDEATPLVPAGPPRTIGLAQLVVLSYFITCGGPFGIEPAVGAAGALLTIMGLFVIVAFWCLPQAVMAAELALLCHSQNGGSILWVNRAFGDAGNFINSFTVLFASSCSSALSLALFGNYMQAAPVLRPDWIVWVGRIVVTVVSIGINIAGPHIIAGLSTALTLVMFVPFLIMLVVLGLHGHLSASSDWVASMSYTPPFDSITWGVLVSTLVWALGGYDYVGALCGEVKGGPKIFFKGILLSLPLALVTYAGPIMLAVTATPVFSAAGMQNWYPGSYTATATSVAPWLGSVMIASCCLGMLGQVVSGTAVSARQLCAMSGSITPAFLGYSLRNGAPVVSIVVEGLVMLGLSAVPFNTLAQVFLLQRIVALFFCYAALIRLRVIEKETPRPYTVPGGMIGAVGLLVPTAVFAFFTLYFMRDVDVWIASGAVELTIILAYVVRILVLRCKGVKVELVRLKSSAPPTRSSVIMLDPSTDDDAAAAGELKTK